jgi:leader peptidase (prepilin peptidase) / N-methyltransferase
MLEYLDYTNLAIIFIAGLLFGSFMNVVIFRIPKSMSVIKPASQCPQCSEKLKWYENIPLISYIFLLGKCSHCKTKISMQYPLVEFFNGLLLIGIAYFSTDIPHFIIYSLLGMTLLCLVVIDFKNYILPDSLIIIASVIILIYFGYYENLGALPRFYYALLTGSGMYVLRMVTSKIYKKETFGLGDIKLSALIGFIVGYWDAFIAIFFGFILAAVIFTILIITRLQKKDTYLPFGPYLILGMILYIMYGDIVIRWYIKFFI